MQIVTKNDYLIYTPDGGPFLRRKYPGVSWPSELAWLTNEYRGKLLCAETLTYPLADIRKLQSMGYTFKEIHCLSSITRGEYDTVGYPLGQHGQYIWTRVMLPNGHLTDWVYVGDNVSPDAAARDCASHVLSNLTFRHRGNLRQAVFGR